MGKWMASERAFAQLADNRRPFGPKVLGAKPDPADVAPALKQSAATDGPGGEHCLPEHLGCKMVGRAGLEPAPSPYKEPALTA